jgi:perosamine synthetase
VNETLEPIPFHRPSIGDAERRAVEAVLDSGWLTTGARSAEFESAIAQFVGTRHAVAVNSATAALHLAFEGLGIGEGDEVVVPTYTFAASAETVLYLRARPVLVDVDPVTANVDPDAVRAALGPRSRAVEVVHIAGLPADMPAILDVAGAVPIIEDAAHAFPSPIAALAGRFAGTVGRAGAYSFYATKTITTGEGGMLVTDDEALARRAQSMRLHGIGSDSWKRYSADGSWYYEIEAAGFKVNLGDLAAAIGLAQLRRAHELRAARAAIARRYLVAFADDAAAGRLVLPAAGTADEHAWHLFIARIGAEAGTRARRAVDMALPGVAGVPGSLRPTASLRARVITSLRKRGIGVSVHFIPLHLHPLYREMGHVPGQYPAAEALYAGAISLPIWPGLADAQLDRIVDSVRTSLES